MSLREVKVPAENIRLGDVEVSLRALSLPEVSGLFRSHAGTLARAWDAFGPLIQDENPFQASTAVFALVGECSDLIADIIAIAADEPESRCFAAALPIEMQFRASITIFRLTLGSNDPQTILRDFQDAMGPAATLWAGTKH